MNDKRPWKSRMERDIIMHDDLRVSGLQGGKIAGEKMGLFSLIIGIPILLIGLYALFSMILDLGFPLSSATVILVAIILSFGSLFTIAGILLYKYK